MAPPEDQPDPLYLVHDGERIVVALDPPGIEGAVEESAYGAVEVTHLGPESAIRPDPPGLRLAKAWYGAGAAVGLSAGVATAEAVSLGVGIPLTVAAAVALALGYRRRRRVLTSSWRQRHRVLQHPEDTAAFTTAWTASERVIDAWPHLAGMIGVPDPGPTLARSLWTLSAVLVDRATHRDHRDELDEIRADLPTGTEVRHDVDDRVSQLDATLGTFDTEVDNR